MIDLHVHSCYSDGELLPKDIIMYLSRKGFTKISIADHNTVANSFNEDLITARNLGMDLLIAIEISSAFTTGEVHILGYDFDIEKLAAIPELSTYLKSITAFYQDAGVQICKLTQQNPSKVRGKDGRYHELSLSEQELKDVGQGVSTHTGLVGMLINRKLKGFTGETVSPYETMKLFLKQTESIKNKYEGFIRKHDIKFGAKSLSLYDKKPNLIEAEKAIKFILDANGVPVIAHPCEQKLEFSHLSDLKSMALKGIEVYSPKNENTVQHYSDIAHQLNLIATGGTDWHGPETMVDIKPGFYSKGETIPDFCWDEIKKAKSSI